MPILKKNSFLLILLNLFFVSCDPPEYLENKLINGHSFNENVETFEIDEKEKPLPDNHLKRNVETFYQNKRKKEKIDLLWVIDNSGSMEDEQHSLARNFSPTESNVNS